MDINQFDNSAIFLPYKSRNNCALTVHHLCILCADIAQMVHRWCTDDAQMVHRKYSVVMTYALVGTCEVESGPKG